MDFIVVKHQERFKTINKTTIIVIIFVCCPSVAFSIKVQVQMRPKLLHCIKLRKLKR